MSDPVCGSARLTPGGASPLPHPATHRMLAPDGRAGERAGTAEGSPLERARGVIGARFRLHGRDVAHGLDCVGLAGLAFGVDVPRGYALRGGTAERIEAVVRAAGLVRARDARPGDLVLFRAGPGQLHLGIASETGVIHADAGLRRVVERPGEPPWPELARWRRED